MPVIRTTPLAAKLRAALEWCGWDSSFRSGRAGRAGNQPGSSSTVKELQDYNRYRLSYGQFVGSAAAGFMIVFAAVYLIYHSFAVSCLLAAAGLAAPRLYKSSLLVRRKERLQLQFKEALYSLASSLAAGKSVENAFLATIDDLKLLYPDPNTELLVEFQIIKHRLDNAEPLEQALRSLAKRAHLDDITQFADVFAVCKRSGGDLVEVMKRTSQTIGEKLEVKQEISVLLAQKRFEARIMMVVPFAFLGFLSAFAPDYMKPLYGGAGYALLTIGLTVLAFCFWLIHRIMQIRV
ncbi:type II secretion system F family protein [Paenibacillus glycanilyticus]|uniref:type II secretion system F family protein n=1 Tax=Paenibacillus glycanilyticus TaxID=126569 RepID=UPI002040634B|nr:type II secretion system F family protein [Paenibacillus glycanilyticus]MCM3628817.1 type II secretion system F family protein [Paenibacillus glycanilyticus]